MANRDEIIAKIKALRAKAEDAAATEAEAMSAAEFAARLLTRHDIKPDELAEVIKSEGAVSGFRQVKLTLAEAELIASILRDKDLDALAEKFSSANVLEEAGDDDVPF